MSPTPASYPNCPRKPPVNPVNKVNPVPIPNQEGWWWAKGRLGWTCVRVRQLDGVWVGLNPYDGIERPLHFPNDAYWDGITWHSEALPPTQNTAPTSSLSPWTEPDRSGGGGHTPDEIRLAAGDVW